MIGSAAEFSAKIESSQSRLKAFTNSTIATTRTDWGRTSLQTDTSFRHVGTETSCVCGHLGGATSSERPSSYVLDMRGIFDWWRHDKDAEELIRSMYIPLADLREEGVYSERQEAYCTVL